MSQAPFSAEERLKELKETYYKLFSERDSGKKFVFPSDEYLLHYRRLFPVQSTSHKDAQEERKDSKGEVGYRGSFDESYLYASKIQPKLRLRPLLEDLNRKGSIEKRNFMLQRMDELAGSKPTKVMDYVKKQYPTSEKIGEKDDVSDSIDLESSQKPIEGRKRVSIGSDSAKTTLVNNDVLDDSSANTFFLLGDVHRCIREYLVANGWIEKFLNLLEHDPGTT